MFAVVMISRDGLFAIRTYYYNSVLKYTPGRDAGTQGRREASGKIGMKK